MTDTRTQLKARFASGQRIGESDFSALIDSLAHLTEDIANGSLAEGDQLSALSVGLDDLKIYAEAIRSEFDSYIGSHPTLDEVNAADAQVSNDLNASLTQAVQGLQDTDNELLSSINSNTDIALELLVLFTDTFDAIDRDLTSLETNSATTELLNLKVSELQSEIESKADTVHTHEEYATKVSIENFITADDIPNFAAEVHQHTAADITDLAGMFATDARVLELIEENRSTIDVNAIIADGYYSKGEVDQKFYVFTLDTSQVTGFNTEVSSIAASVAQVELATAKEQISADLNIDTIEQNVTNLDTELTSLATTVSANSTAITANDTQVRLDFASADESVRTDFAAGDESVRTDFAAADESIRTDFAAADVQIGLDFAAADEATLTSAKDYADGRITELIGGASDAFDTLKEIETALSSGEATGDVLTSLNNINDEIDANDTELDNIRKWLGRTADELALEPSTTALSSDVDAGETIINVLDQTGFSIGDEIVIGEGTSSEEATISDLGSLVLESPLTKSHAAGSKVSLRNPLVSSIASISGGSASSSDLEALQQTVSNLESNISTLQQNQTNLETDLEAANSSVTTLQTELTTANSSITTLQTDLATANSSITTLETDLATANTSITTLETDLATANTSITTLQTDLDTAELEVATLTTDLETAQTSITSLGEQITAQELLIQELEQAIEEGVYSQNNYFARYYVTDGYAATFESGYYVEDGYTSIGYTSQYA